MTIIAVGCAGGRILSKTGLDFDAINTDKYQLESCRARTKLLIGEQRFLGRGGAAPDIIMEEAGRSVEAIAGLCAGTVVIVAGLGKGTGTGLAPLVARIAQRQGCKTIAVVTEPLPSEGRECLVYAKVALRTLGCVDELISVRLAELSRLAVLGEVVRDADAVAAAAVGRLMTPVKGPGKKKSARRRALAV
jgi:cell division protein FtsZ